MIEATLKPKQADVKQVAITAIPAIHQMTPAPFDNTGTQMY